MRRPGVPTRRSDPHACEESGNIVGMQPDAAMAAELVHARGRVGAVDAASPPVQPDPVRAEGVVGTGRHFRENRFPKGEQFVPDRLRYDPGFVALPRDDGEFPGGRGPGGLARADGIGGDELPLRHVKQHALRYVDEQAVAQRGRYDMEIADVQALPGANPVGIGKGVVAGEQPRIDAEARADGDQEIAWADKVFELAAGHLGRQGQCLRPCGERVEDKQKGEERTGGRADEAVQPHSPNSASVARRPYLSCGGIGRVRQSGSRASDDLLRPGGRAPLPKPFA